MQAIETHRLSKSYGSRRVLEGVSVDIPTGTCCGLLGPNGAGKTTLIRVLLGFLRASHGEARVLGQDCWRDGPRLRQDVGYLPGEVRFYERLTGARTLAFFNAVRGGGHTAEIRRLAELFDLDLSRRVRAYSQGMRQKLGLIQALMHRPRLLVLDEPTTALDPLVRRTLFAELRQVSRQGRTVLFSSHTLAEVEELCDEVAILRGGRLVEMSRVDDLRRRAVRHVEITFRDGRAPIAPPPDALRVVSRDARHLSGTLVGAVDPLLAWLAAAPVEDVSISPPHLDDLFMAYYGGAEPLPC